MEQRINLDRMEQAAELFGSFDGNMKQLEQRYGVALVFRDSELKITGEDPEAVDKAARVVKSLITLIGGGETLTDQNVRYCMQMVEEDGDDKVARLAGDCICITSKGKPIKPKTVGQRTYCDNIRDNTITIGVGPAGTGKTYLAVAMAVKAFRAQEINRIILTRPAVEAGEKLGFLPGDLQQKVDPYLRPLYDALFDMLGAETYQRYVERGNIEVAPLAYAGPHPGRQLHHPGRGPEHHRGADEDVPHPAGVWLENGHHRGHHPDRPAGREEVRPERGGAHLKGHRGHRRVPFYGEGRGAPPAGAGHHPGLRAGQPDKVTKFPK